MPTKIGVPKGNYTNMMVQEDKRPWWEKYESNADKARKDFTISEEDLKFLKQFGAINISIAGIYAVNKLLKK